MSLLPEKKANSIWACAQDGNLQGVMDCVEKQHKEVNSVDEDGRTALHVFSIFSFFSLIVSGLLPMEKN